MLINRVLKLKDLSAVSLSELRQAVVVIANNVAEYLYVTNDQEHWELSEDFPNVAPPWPNMWIEWPEPRICHIYKYLSAGETLIYLSILPYR